MNLTHTLLQNGANIKQLTPLHVQTVMESHMCVLVPDGLFDTCCVFQSFVDRLVLLFTRRRVLARTLSSGVQ